MMKGTRACLLTLQKAVDSDDVEVDMIFERI